VRSDPERLRDVLEAIERIERYVSRGREVFERDELVQNWVVNHLQIVGEAAARLTPAFREDHPEIPWREIIGMRNILVHEYFGIDLGAAWEAVENDLPALRSTITKILGSV
jgi:uncharacterized protein with HEPN domain